MDDFFDSLNEHVETRVFSDLQGYVRGEGSAHDGGIGVIHFNIRSLRKYFDELLVHLQIILEHVDIVVLSETGVILSVSEFTIPGFTTYYNESKVNKCDGVVVLVRDSLCPNMSISPIGKNRFLRITFTINDNLKQIQFGITASYRSPSTDPRKYIDNLENYFQGVRKQQIEIFVGDININLLKETNSDTNDYLNIMNSHGFISHINKPTRVTNQSESLIDHIFIRQEGSLKHIIAVDSILFHTDMTDHYTPFVAITYSAPKSRVDLKTMRLKELAILH